MTTMSFEEREKYLKDLKEYAKKVTSDKKLAKELLYKAGIHTKKGRLAKAYKDSK